MQGEGSVCTDYWGEGLTIRRGVRGYNARGRECMH